MTPDDWFTECPDVSLWQAMLLRNSRPVSGGCIEWTGRRRKYGYGAFRVMVDGVARETGAYRAAWLAYRGPIPPGMVLDHLCRNAPCINPDHLEVVTPEVNTERMVAAQSGGPAFHLLGKADDEKACNTHGREDGYLRTVRYRRNVQTRWECRICRRERVKRWEQRQAA